MIQRIQSVYLLLASILMLIVGIVFLYNVFLLGTTSTMSEVFNGFWGILYLVFVLDSAVMSFITIFHYRKRMAQVRLTAVNFFDTVISVLLFIGLFLFKGLDLQWMPYVPLSILAIVLLILACRNIIKDEKLVRSADRIR